MGQQVIRVTLQDGSVKTYPAGTPIEQIQAEIKGSASKPATAPPGLESMTPQSTGEGDLSIFEPREFLSGMIKAGTAATSLLGGPTLPMMGLRTALGAAGDATAAAVKGDENPLDAAMFGGAMNAGGEVVGKAIPAVTTPLAIAVGGSLKSIKNIPKAAGAFNREAERRAIPLPVGGNKARATAARQEGAQAIEAAENANPNQVPLRGLTNSNADLSQKQVNVYPNGLRNRADIDSMDQQFVESQALMRNYIRPEDFEKFVDAQWNNIASNRQMMMQAAQHFGRRPTRDDIRTLMMNQLVDATQLNARELGELKRGVRASGQDVIDARMDKTWVPPAERVRGSAAANTSERAGEHYKRIDRDTRTPMERMRSADKGGDMERANARFGDLATIEETNKAVRTDPSMYIIRSGAGGTIAGGLGALFGVPNLWQLGSALGFLGTPRNISGLGFGASRAARYGPGGIRAGEAVEDMTPDKPKRRSPK